MLGGTMGVAEDTQPHVHDHALAALVARYMERTGATKSDVARDALLTPARFGDLLAGRRAGRSEATRVRLADAIGEPVEAITCRCQDRVGNHGGRR